MCKSNLNILENISKYFLFDKFICFLYVEEKLMKRILAIILCVTFGFMCGCSENYAERVSWKERNFEVVELDDNERYMSGTELDKAMLEEAMQRACDRIKENISEFNGKFPATCSKKGEYEVSERFNWESGMLVGCYWLAYQYTGDEVFKNAAEDMIEIFAEHAKTGEWLNDHDTGFIYSPSCVAGYKITGDKTMRESALDAADILYSHYDTENKFIIRSGKRSDNNYDMYRALVDSMMNIPLFFFAYEETGDEKYLNAAVDHYHTTMTYLIRDDGSSYHHYQFDPESGNPVKGVTWQGYSDDSCWTRGHSWLLYGFPIAYSYTKNAEILPLYKNISNYYLNRLPIDNIPYWDLIFTEDSDEPRDSSAAAISTCGFLEMYNLCEDEEQKKILKNAADAQMLSLIENCENKGEGDGIVLHVTHALPQGQGIDESAVYADYFYMEALMRYLNPDFVRYW